MKQFWAIIVVFLIVLVAPLAVIFAPTYAQTTIVESSYKVELIRSPEGGRFGMLITFNDGMRCFSPQRGGVHCWSVK